MQLYRERLRSLREEFPDVSNESLRSVLMTMSRFDVDDVDFDLICRAGIWFAAHDASGYTAREVPLEAVRKAILNA